MRLILITIVVTILMLLGVVKRGAILQAFGMCTTDLSQCDD